MSNNEQLYVTNVAYVDGNGGSYIHKSFKEALDEAKQIVIDIIEEFNGDDDEYEQIGEGNVLIDEHNGWYTVNIEYDNGTLYAIVTVNKVFNNL